MKKAKFFKPLYVATKAAVLFLGLLHQSLDVPLELFNSVIPKSKAPDLLLKINLDVILSVMGVNVNTANN